MNLRRRLILAVPLAAVLLGLGTGSARAAGPEVGVTDDRLLLVGGADPDRLVAEWRANGVDVVRIFALWSQIAPAHQPAGFDGANQHAPGYTWGRLDEAVRRVRGAGMKVMLTVTGPGPVWTSRSPGRGNPRYKPDPARVRGLRDRGRRPATAPTSTATSSGTSPTSLRGSSRRRAARTAAARRSRRTSTAASCAPPIPRSRRPTPAPRC